MPRATHWTTRVAGALSVPALVLAASGCGQQKAQTESAALVEEASDAASQPEAEPTDAPQTTAPPAPGDPTTPTPSPSDPEGAGSEEPTTTLQQHGSLATFRDQELDLSDRHPNGTRLHIGGIRFQGTAVLVDAEFINGYTSEININLLKGGTGMRLVDDLGNAYNVVEPEGSDGEVEIASGETLTGSWAFLGPIEPDATELRLMVNLWMDQLDTYNPETRYHLHPSPAFLMGPIPLEAEEA